MSWEVLARRGPVLRQCEGRTFQADTKDPKKEMNRASSRNKGRKVGLQKGEQGEAGRRGSQTRATPQLWAVLESLALLSVTGSP